MKVRHLLSIADLGLDHLSDLVSRGLQIAARGTAPQNLEGKMVGIYFRGSSTRTRTSFTVGAHKLGADVIHYAPNDLQLVTGENVEDTGRVLSGYLDALVVRTNDSPEEMRALAAQGKMSIINAMSSEEHPTQAITDLISIRGAFGRLKGLHVLYIGEGNNSAASLALAVALTPGMQLTVVTPEGYGLAENVLQQSQRFAKKHGASVEQHHCMNRLPKNVDVVYTTRWQTMGVPKADVNWREKFEPYRVTQSVMAQVSKPSGTIFLHDLPAIRGSEVVDEVLDGPQSLAFQQARHKLTAAMAVLSWCAESNGNGS